MQLLKCPHRIFIPYCCVSMLLVYWLQFTKRNDFSQLASQLGVLFFSHSIFWREHCPFWSRSMFCATPSNEQYLEIVTMKLKGWLCNATGCSTSRSRSLVHSWKSLSTNLVSIGSNKEGCRVECHFKQGVHTQLVDLGRKHQKFSAICGVNNFVPSPLATMQSVRVTCTGDIAVCFPRLLYMRILLYRFTSWKDEPWQRQVGGMLQYTMTTTGILKALIILVVCLRAGKLLLLKLDITVWFSTCVPFHNHYVPSFKSLNKVVLIVILVGYLKDFFMFTSYDNWIWLGTYACAGCFDGSLTLFRLSLLQHWRLQFGCASRTGG